MQSWIGELRVSALRCRLKPGTDYRSRPGRVRCRRGSCRLFVAAGATLLFGIAATLSPAVFAQSTPGEWHVRGLGKVDKQDLDGAIADFTRAIELDPQYASAYGDRGLAKQSKGDQDGATA